MLVSSVTVPQSRQVLFPSLEELVSQLPHGLEKRQLSLTNQPFPFCVLASSRPSPKARDSGALMCL